MFALLSTGFSGVFYNNANATSSYDDLVKYVTSLEVGYSWNNPPLLVLSDAEYMRYFTQYCPSTAVVSFNAALDRGSNFAIMQGSYIDASEKHPAFMWQNNASGDFTGTFETSGSPDYVTQSLKLSPSGGASFAYYSLSYDSDWGWSCDGFISSGTFSIVMEEVEIATNTIYNSRQALVSTFSNITYPSGYDGQLIEGGTRDVDGDGLDLLQELRQGTSDSAVDTDEDGIDDMKESEWFTGRDGLFCNTSVTPKVCAYPNPISQDVYIEMDWVYNSLLDKTYKPTGVQLELVREVYADEGINLHIDDGSYGGGNMISIDTSSIRYDSIASIPDFGDYKNGGDGVVANFNSARLNVWRYMIFGNAYSDGNGLINSSGWAEVMGDDFFVSGDVIESAQGVVDEDRAVANTITHELGHTMCLSKIRVYFEQDQGCVFEGIDNNSGLSPGTPDAYYNLEGYESVMNYRYQLTIEDDIGSVAYSHGLNGSSDNDDWLAIKNHLGAFNGPHTLYVEFGARTARLVDTHVSLSADGLVIARSI